MYIVKFEQEITFALNEKVLTYSNFLIIFIFFSFKKTTAVGEVIYLFFQKFILQTKFRSKT